MARPSIHVLEVKMPLRPFSLKGDNGLIQAQPAEGQAGPSDDHDDDDILRAKKNGSGDSTRGGRQRRTSCLLYTSPSPRD